MARNLSLVRAPIGLLLLSSAGGAAPSEPSSTLLGHHHALSLVGEPAYDPDFAHFSWVNPDAPKGGPASKLGLIYDTLFVNSPDEPSTVAATRALDRALLWNHYVVPQWNTPYDRLAMWNVYDRPNKLPRLDASFLRVWWWDEARAKQSNAGD